MKKIALYARVSTDEQAEGHSIDAQLEKLREFAKEKGCRIYKEYVDIGYSGGTDDRPGLNDYRIFVGARDYGDNLDISWYLTCEPKFFKRYLSNILTGGASDKALSFNLDLFQQQDLNAYTTVVHTAF